MKNKIIRTIFGAGIIAIASSASAEDSGRSVWEAIVDTLPAGVVSEENSSGSYLSDTWVGMKTIISEGSSGLLLPAYTIHPGYAYKTEKRHNENGYTWGGGISRNFIDSRGNRRIMYAMAFSDSHNNFEPFMGYGWLSRWRLGSTPFYAEAGYTIGDRPRRLQMDSFPGAAAFGRCRHGQLQHLRNLCSVLRHLFLLRQHDV